jgi:hypothetical protein
MTLYEPRSGVSMHHYHLIENNSRPHAACCETYTLMSLYPFHMNIYPVCSRRRGTCHSSLLLPVLRDLVPLTHERHHEPWKTVRRYTFVIFLVGQYHSRLDTSTIPE